MSNGQVEKHRLKQIGNVDLDLCVELGRKVLSADQARSMTAGDLIPLDKLAGPELAEKVLGNMSERMRNFIIEELNFLGPMRLSEVEEVQLRIVQTVRQLEEEGQLTIVRGDADDSFV